MMRYQRVSPDCLPLCSGKNLNSRTCKEDDGENGRIQNHPNFEEKSLRFRSGTSPSTSHDLELSQIIANSLLQHENHSPVKNNNNENSPGGGDILLQWGQNKRSRGSRAENRVVTEESSVRSRQVLKIARKVVSKMDKQRKNQSTTMSPPPPPPPCSSAYSRGTNLRPGSGPLQNRNLEERSVPGNGFPSSNGSSLINPRSVEKRSPTPSDKTDRTAAASCSVAAKDPVNPESTPQLSDPEASAVAEKLNLDLFEWPRLYISLSRKEKEDDFLAMKGTKLSQRPKKRAKNVDKTLQYCFPGMWLSDLTRGRYEVREKKCVKKKRRGLKGMEDMESDSE